MRVNLSLFIVTGILFGVSPLAHAKRTKSADAVAPVESAAARAARLAMADDTGARRDSDLRAPSLAIAAVPAGPESAERGPSEAQGKSAETGTLSGAMEELIARQMQRNGAAIDQCVAELHARDPHLRGDLEITVTVVQKRTSATVAAAPLRGDAAFVACVAESGKGMRLGLPDLVFPWRVHLGR